VSANSAEAIATSAPDQGWHWPTPEHLLAFVRYAVLIQLLWIVIYGGCSWLTAQHTLRVPLGTPWDARIPFVPAAAAVYLSLTPMLWLAPFLLRKQGELKTLAKALAWLILLSGLGFVLLPADAPMLPHAVASAATATPLLRLADAINLNHNLCPSLHVGMAMLCAYAYTRRKHPMQTRLLWLWTAAIAASTLLIRDHYLIDVAAGAVLGFLVAKLVFCSSLGSSSPSKTAPLTTPEAAAAPTPQQ
jgi:membrane-associated phospholipid phosphatase